MKEKLIRILAVVLAVMTGVCLLASCVGNEQKETQPQTVYYTVSFDLDGGAVAGKDLTGGLKVKENTVVKLAEYVPTKEGYVFAGYKCEEQVYQATDSLTVRENMTLTAQWEQNIVTKPTFTVSFDPAGGTIENETVTVEEGSTITLNNAPSREGYLFDGWKCGETMYKSNTQVTVTEDMTFVAQWTQIPVYFEVQFDLNGGSMTGVDLSKPLQVLKGASVELSGYVPKKTDYVFGGWKLGETVFKSSDRVVVDENMTLVAVWTPVATYEISFDAAGGTLSGNKVIFKEGATLQFAKYVPTREGYDFLGWKDANGKLYATTDSLRVTAKATFTAQWQVSATDAEKFVFTLAADGKSYILSELASGFDVANVVIPGEYLGLPVTEIAERVFSYEDSIVTLDLTRCYALTKIGSWNFTSCDNLEKVDLGGCEKLESIGTACFTALPKIAVANFKGLSGLRTIGDTFFGYVGITPTYMGVEVLDFSDCVALESIGRHSFWYLTGLRQLDFSNTQLESIGYKCILHCPALESISLPITLDPKNIGGEFITESDGLKAIHVAEGSLYLTSENGVLYDYDKTILIKYPIASEATTYTAPASLKRVWAQAVRNAKNLKSIDMSDCTLEAVEYAGFAGCVNATLTVAFNENGINENGSSVSRALDWNSGVKKTDYLKVVEITVSGATNGAMWVGESIDLQVNATYGPDACAIVLKVNGTVVTSNSTTYTVPLNLGENTVEIVATYGAKTATKTLTITRVAGKPTISTTLDSTVISWYGSTVDFVITARDAAGNPILSKDIAIYYAWGYGSYVQDYGVTLTDNSDGTVTASVSYDRYADMCYLDGDTEITMTIVAKSGSLEADTTCTVDWKAEAPKLTVSTTLANGTETNKNTPLNFTITATNAGKKLGKSSVSLKYNYGYGDYNLTSSDYTLTDNPDSTVGVTVDFTSYADMGFFDYDDKEITLIVVVSDGALSKTLRYTIKWVEI